MIPFFGAQTISIFGLFSIQVWGTLLAFGYGVATFIAYRRAKKLGLNADHVLSVAGWIFIAAMLGSRLFHVFVYEPGYYLSNPLAILDFRRPGYAITGGFIGALIAFSMFVRHHRLNWIAYADTLAWGIPWGCGIGRIGCFLIHDHPGTLSHSILAVKYPDGQGRHDLGLYLSLVGFAMGILFLILNRKPRQPGFWVALFFFIDGITRIGLDYLRTVDIRYFGWTPAQWASAIVVLVSVGWFASTSKELLRAK